MLYVPHNGCVLPTLFVSSHLISALEVVGQLQATQSERQIKILEGFTLCR